MPNPEGFEINTLQNVTSEQIVKTPETMEVKQEVLRQASKNTELLTDLSAIANNVAKKGTEQVIKVFKIIFSK